MPDISMCSSTTCPKKNECYRHEATPDEYQCYSDFKEYEGENCRYFMKLKQ